LLPILPFDFSEAVAQWQRPNGLTWLPDATPGGFLRHQRRVAVEWTSVSSVLIREKASQTFIVGLVKEWTGWIRPNVRLPTNQELPDMSWQPKRFEDVVSAVDRV
jgi:hypothetical protein